MNTLPRTVTFKGTPLNLVGRKPRVPGEAANFRVINQDLGEVMLADFPGKIKVISFFPSLDTPVCDLQVKEFNQRAAEVSAGVVVIGISKDLPFAQKRFCAMNEIKSEVVLSDYKTSSFGINYGVLIKELNLLARGVMIIDQNNLLRYMQIAGELTSSVDYADTLVNLDSIMENPLSLPGQGLPAHCRPCEGGVAPLSKERVERLLAASRGWELVEDKKIIKEFKFKDFPEAKYFLDLITVIAGEQGHHPTVTISYNKIKITLTTHAAGGLTDNDFIMSRIIDEL